jgi:hypothetical protein
MSKWPGGEGRGTDNHSRIANKNVPPTCNIES